MTSDRSGSTVTLYPSRRKWFWITAGALGFTLVGAWMVMRGEPYGWFVSVIFGLSLIMCGALFLPGAFSLTLTHEGFAICAFWRRHTYCWRDVCDFRVIEMPQGMTVAFDFSDAAARPKGSDLAVALTDADAALPDTYGMAASELADLMSAWREKAIGAARGAIP